MAAEGEPARVPGLSMAVSAELSAAVQRERVQTLLQVCTQVPGLTTMSRVPSLLRDGNETTYTPQLFSIGPYHFNNVNLRQTHGIKVQYLHDFVHRDPEAKSRGIIHQGLANYARIAEKHLADLNQQYPPGISLSDKEFMAMMVVDGCFIIEFLIKWYLNDRKTQSNIVKANLPVVRTDLLLVENQVPFFILEEFFVASRIPQLSQNFGLVELALVYLSGDRVGAQMAAGHYWDTPKLKALGMHHILHLYHLLCLNPESIMQVQRQSTPMHISKQLTSNSCLYLLVLFGRFLMWVCLPSIFSGPRWLLSRVWLLINKAIGFTFWILYLIFSKSSTESTCSQNLIGIPNASNLRDTGFKFKKSEPLSRFSYVTREGRTIKIPALSACATPLKLLKNLMASEQSCLEYGNCFTAFATLMDYLIDTAEDVAILKKAGIIDKGFGDDETVAEFFNGLCKGICFDHEKHYLRETLFDFVGEYYVEKYHIVRFYQWRNGIMPDFFSNPLAMPSMIMAFIATVLAVTSTFYTVYPYYHPRS